MMTKRIAFVAGAALGAGVAGAQMNPNLGAAGTIAPGMRASEPGGISNVRNPIVASLTYDGSSTWGFAGQDFESVFDAYDTTVVEPFSVSGDFTLTEFRSTGFGTANPFGATDIVARIYHARDLGGLCDDGTLPDAFLTSTPGAGFYDGVDGVTDFGGQCLPAGDYLLSWGAELRFTTFGQLFFFGQFGAHDNGGGEQGDAFQSNPGDGFGMGVCFGIIDGVMILPTGVNFILCGDAGDCGGCPDATGCGDWDGDGDSDGDDFFDFLGAFADGEECADLDGDGDRDGDDFFAFLGRFVEPC